MSSVTYEWAPGSQVSTPASEAGPMLQRFAAKGFTATEVLAAGRKHSPDHWLRRELWIDREDKDLAEQMRLERARDLVRHMLVRHGDSEPRRLTVAITTYKRDDTDDDGRAYMPRSDVLANPLLRGQMVHRGRQSLRSWLSAYSDLEEFVRPVAAIRAFLGESLEGGEEPHDF